MESRRPAPDRTRPGVAVRLQPDHGAARAERADPRATTRADTRARDVRAPSADRSRLHRPALLQRGDAAPRTRSGDAAGRGPTRVRGGGRGERPRARTRLADALPGTVAPRRRRAAAARAGPPASGAVSRAAGVRPRARLPLRPADRTVWRAHREGAGSPRAGPAQGPRGASSGSASRDAGPAHRRHRNHRGGSSGRIRPDLRAWRSDPLLRGAGGGPAEMDRIGCGPEVRGGGLHDWLLDQSRRSRRRRSGAGSPARVAVLFAVAGAGRVGLRRVHEQLGPVSGRVQQPRSIGCRGVAGCVGGEPSASPVPTPLPENDSEAKPGDIARPLVLLPRGGRPARAGRGRAEGRRRLQRHAPRASTCASRATSSPRRATRSRSSSAPARGPTSSVRSASAAPTRSTASGWTCSRSSTRTTST